MVLEIGLAIPIEPRQLAPFVAFRLLIASRLFQRNVEHYICPLLFCKGDLRDYVRLLCYEPKLAYHDP